MIRPPFTLLVLKNGRPPATIRVTTAVFVSLLAVIPLLCGMAGFGLSRLMPRHTVATPATSPAPPGQTAETGAPVPGDTRADIGGVFVSRTSGGELEISFTPVDLPAGEACHAWIIGNPDDAREPLFVYPRGPVFHGLPVDYRNGISFMPVNGRSVTITADEVPDEMPGEIRILIYSSGGELLIDKHATLDPPRGR